MTKGDWKKPTGFGPRLMKARNASGLNQKSLAELVGCSLSVIAKLEQGIQEPTWPLLLAIARALGLSATDFDEEAPKTEPVQPPVIETVAIPLRGRVAAGHGTYDESPAATIDVARNFAGHVAYRVVGDSMEDEGIFHDDYLIVREQPTAESRQIVVVTLADQGEVCKVYDKINHRLTCQSGRRIQPLTDDDIIRGIVVWLIRRY